MTFNNDTYVDMGEWDIGTGLIWTDAIGTCNAYLITGDVKGHPFGYLEHEPFVKEDPGTPLEDLRDMLERFLKQMTKKVNQHFQIKAHITDFDHLKLLVVGGAETENEDNDRERDALYLLVKPNEIFYDFIVEKLDGAIGILFQKLCFQTIILKPITYQHSETKDAKSYEAKIEFNDEPCLRLYYHCPFGIGLLAIEWECALDNLDIAYMFFHMNLTQEDEYKWKVQQTRIEQSKIKIGTRHTELQELNIAQSYIPAQSLFVSSMSYERLDVKSTEDDDEKMDDKEEAEYGNVLTFNIIQRQQDFHNPIIKFICDNADNMFNDKTIIDNEYQNIFLHCVPSSLNFYLIIDHNTRINPRANWQFQVNNIVEPLNQWITITENNQRFLSDLSKQNEYTTFGKQILSYELQEEGKEESMTYLINRVNREFRNNKEFADWFSRLETFLIFYINGASRIDKDYSNWIIYLLYQQYQDDRKQTCHAPIGFIIVYLRYVDFNKMEASINQMLILPPYQRQGHGRHLLTTVYNDLQQYSQVQYVTAVNPSKNFIKLRDLAALELCHKYLPNLFSSESILRINQLTKEMIDHAQDVCKLTKEETQRVYEMCLLNSIDQNNEEQMKRFSVIVKQRLNDLLKMPDFGDISSEKAGLFRCFLLTSEYKYLLKYYKVRLERFST